MTSEETLQRIEKMVTEGIGYFERIKNVFRETLDDKGRERFGKFIGDIVDKIENQEPLEGIEQKYLINLLKLEVCKRLQDAIFLDRYEKR